MKRFTRSYRTRKNVADQSALRDQFIRDLTKEANALILQLSQQFNENLQTQMTQALQGIVAGDAAMPTTMGTPETGTIGSLGQLLSTGARYLISRPRTSRDTAETSRSIDATGFKLSRSQAMVEAQIVMSMGDKNS